MNSLANTTYLDHHATTPLCAASREAIHAALTTELGNPSSIHGSGQAARHAIERARAQVARAVGCPARSVVFTSGATEANALAWRAMALTSGDVAVTSAIEHVAVELLAQSADARGCQVTRLPVDDAGHLRLEALPERWAWASVIMVSNELGLVLPIEAIAARCKEVGALFHTDATQALGKVELTSCEADLISLSAHKIGGPAGVGALIVRDGVDLPPIWRGHQERGLRGGTENLLGVIGFGAACEQVPTRLAEMDRVRQLRDQLAAEVAALPFETYRHLAAVPPERESGTCLSVAFPGLDASDLVMALDIEGVAISAGSACSSGTLQPSEVIRHISRHLPDPEGTARGTVRITLGPESHRGDVEHLISALRVTLPRLLPTNH